MAKAEGSPGNHLEPTTMFAEAWPSLSPPLLDASTAGKAHRALVAGGSTPGEEAGETPLAGHMPMHPMHVDHRERGKGWTWSTMDPALGPWTVNLHPPWTTPVDHSPVRAHDYDVAEPQHATCSGQPGPDRPNPKNNRPS